MIVDLICQYCSKSFQVQYKSREQKYCSLRCTSLQGWKVALVRQTFEKPCDICGKTMKTRPTRVKQGRGKYCSKICYWKGMSITQSSKTHSEKTRIKMSNKRKGELNPAFIHGESESMSQYNSKFNLLLKEKIRKRDSYICKMCSAKNSKTVHHLDHNKLNNKLENLITLCNSCHSSYHRTYEYSHGFR